MHNDIFYTLSAHGQVLKMSLLRNSPFASTRLQYKPMVLGGPWIKIHRVVSSASHRTGCTFANLFLQKIIFSLFSSEEPTAKFCKNIF